LLVALLWATCCETVPRYGKAVSRDVEIEEVFGRLLTWETRYRMKKRTMLSAVFGVQEVDP
jgi:hypothetical protein